MMGRSGFSDRCRDVRALVSQDLDQELSELHRTALRFHLQECPDCAAFAREAGSVASALRSAPLEQPSRLVLQIAGPEPAFRRRYRLGVAAAVTVAASAAFGAFFGVSTRHSPSASSAAAAARTSLAATQEPYFEEHVLAMLARSHRPRGRIIAT